MSGHVTCDAEKFSTTAHQMLEEFEGNCNTAVREAIVETADKIVEILKSAGDFGGTKYRRSWKSKIVQTRMSTQAIVHNAKHYRLTHLLEFGHAKQNGGRTRAFPHIEPINERSRDLFEEKLTDLIGGGGRI